MAAREFDGQFVRFPAAVKDVMEQFVCVRMIQANGMDLSLFQFDYDQTFAVFFMNADRTIYGRYGTRSSIEDSDRDLSIEGLGRSMTAALELHRNYPANKATLAGKQGGASRYPTPEKYPSLSNYKSTLDTEGKIVQSCIHCHSVRDAERLVLRDALRPIPDEELFSYPMPDVLGLRLDPRERARVEDVTKKSVAARAGFKPGDEILTLDGQPMGSIADVQWALHHAPTPAMLPAKIRRDGREQTLTLPLEPGWRTKSDISWRATTWDLRRMVTGGIYMEEASDEERAAAKIGKESLALRAQHVGQYNEHAVAKRAGVKADDIIVEWDGQTRPMTETELIHYTLKHRRKGDRIPITVARGEQRLKMELLMQ